MNTLDGWRNVLSKLGLRGRDKSVSITPGPVTLLTTRELARVYASDGLGAKIADVVADDAMRNGFRILKDDDQETLLKACDEVGLDEALIKAYRYCRAFGGSLIVAQYDHDANPLDKPPSPGAVVDGFKVYSSARVPISTTSIVTDERSPYFDDIEIFEVSRRGGGPVRYHASRCFPMKGIACPDDPALEFTSSQLYWGTSVLQRAYIALSNFGAFFQAIGHLGQEMVIGKYRIANLEKLLLTNDTKAIETRMEIIQVQKSVLRAILLGKDEEYTRDALSFAGVADVFDRMSMVLAGACGIPITKLLGRSAAGMNASGDGDSRDYYDMVKAGQKYDLRKAVVWGVKQVDRVSKRISDYAIEFHPVWTPSQKEELEMRERQQKIDAGYIADSVYDAGETRKNRFVGGYSFDTKLEGEGPAPSPEDKAAYAKQLAAAEAKKNGKTEPTA